MKLDVPYFVNTLSYQRNKEEWIRGGNRGGMGEGGESRDWDERKEGKLRLEYKIHYF